MLQGDSALARGLATGNATQDDGDQARDDARLYGASRQARISHAEIG
jgi:hypothetical protein